MHINDRFCCVIYIEIYWHTFYIYIIYHGIKAVCISWIDAKKLAHNSCKPVQDCYVNNNINLAWNGPKIMEKTCWPPTKYTCLKSCSDCSCRQSCKNWMFCSRELMQFNYRSYIPNWVTYITKSHSPLWHICCCIVHSETAIHNNLTNDICYMHMKVKFLTIHFVTFISRVLISPFLHIYGLVSWCLTCATVI